MRPAGYRAATGGLSPPLSTESNNSLLFLQEYKLHYLWWFPTLAVSKSVLSLVARLFIDFTFVVKVKHFPLYL